MSYMKKYSMKNNLHAISIDPTFCHMIKFTTRYFIVLGIMIALTLNFIACTQDTPPSQSPVVTSTSLGPGTFRSEQYHIEVQLPSGWAAVEGPKAIIVPHLEGQVAFNSWGQNDFWTHAIEENYPDGHTNSRYGPGVVPSQIPEGGAFIALVSSFSPSITLPEQNTPTDTPAGYTLNDLSGLYQPHDWRQDAASYAYFKLFYKGDLWLELIIACNQNASDETVTQLNDLLLSWRFDGANP